MHDFERLKEVLDSQEIKEVLDIGWWKGIHALLCASYGAKVDLVDPDDTEGFRFFDFLKWSHPLIKQHAMMAHEFEINKEYDLALLINVITFMKKSFVLNKLLPNISKHLKKKWKVILSFLLDDDDMIIRGVDLSHYTVEEISSAMPELEIVHNIDLKNSDDHPPIGPHCHHIQHMMLTYI